MGLLDQLAGGSRKSTGASDQVAARLLAEPELIEELFPGLLIKDAVVRARCAHALMLTAAEEPGLLQPYKERLFAEMAPQEQWEVRQQFVKIITALQLDEADVLRALGIFSTYLEAPQSFVRTYALQGLFDLTTYEPGLKETVRGLLAANAMTGSAAVRARCRKLLARLNND